MMKVAHIVFVLTLFFSLGSVNAQDATPVSGGAVYLVREGETLASIAKQFLGDEAAVVELATFNSLQADAVLKSGDPIVLPGPERAQAISAMDQARLAMQKAVDAQAGEYSIDEFKRAVALLDSAGQSQTSAIYPRALAIAKMAESEFLNAIRIASAKAQEPKSAKVETIAGGVEALKPDVKDFAAVSVGAAIAAGSVVQTGADGRAILSLPDGTRLTLSPSTRLWLSQLNVDRRDGTTRLGLVLQEGAMSVSAPAAKTKNSSLVITNGMVSVSGLDADFELSHLPDGTARVVAIRNALRIEKDGRIVELLGASGLLVNASGEMKGPFNSPGAAVWIHPAEPGLTTARQVLDFVFRLNGAPDGTVSRLDLARDEAFANILTQQESNDGKLRVGPLAAGVYFARVTGITGGWLKGTASPTLRIEIQPNLDVTFTKEGEIRKDGKRVIGLNNTLSAQASSSDTSVLGVEYSLDGSDFHTAEKGITFDRAGEFKLSARGRGADDQTGKTAVETILVDGTPPDVRIHIGEVLDFPGYGLVRSVSALVDDAIQMGTIEYAMDRADFKPYETPLKLPIGQDHRIRIRATDAFGNKAETAFTLEKILLGDGEEFESTPENPIPPPKKRGWF